MTSTPIVSIPVGVTVERRKAESPWADALWRPVSVLAGTPTAAPWTPIDTDPTVTTYYAGQAVIELYRTETDNYRSNIGSGAPLLWVVLRPTGLDPPFDLLAVTADPAEGEALTGAGNDLVESVPMIDSINATIRAFIAEYHVERSMFKRKRDRAGMRPIDENLK
jgi:hypothetical protein